MLNISVIPLTTEKAYTKNVAHNVYVFKVPLTANKPAIRGAVESQFEVKVDRIKTLVQSGKTIRFSRGKRRNPGVTKRKDIKKAYVTLASGDSIKVFDRAETEENK